jgi:hypothetical protein
VLLMDDSKISVSELMTLIFTYIVKYIEENMKLVNFKATYLFNLNDVESVLQGTSNDSELSGPIEWMTINPGTQAIGCKLTKYTMI